MTEPQQRLPGPEARPPAGGRERSQEAALEQRMDRPDVALAEHEIERAADRGHASAAGEPPEVAAPRRRLAGGRGRPSMKMSRFCSIHWMCV